MWYWSLAWEDEDGEISETQSKIGYPTQWEAQRAYALCEQDVERQLHMMGMVNILDESVVFRNQMTGFNN